LVSAPRVGGKIEPRRRGQEQGTPGAAADANGNGGGGGGGAKGSSAARSKGATSTGYATTNKGFTPVALPGWSASDPISMLAAGHAHSVALTAAGRVFTWGSNEFGQLGWASPPMLGTRNADAALPPGEVRLRRPALVAGAEPATGAGDEDNGYSSGVSSSIPVASIAVGAYHTLLITWAGEVWSFGSNSHGQLARPLLAPDGAPAPILLPPSHHGQAVRAAAAGARHTALLLASGAVCVIGDHTHGQLGVAVPHRRNACAVRGDKGGVVAGGGEGAVGELVMPAVRRLVAGELHTLALTESGEVWSWGDNQMRQCARELKQPILATPGRVPLPLRPGEAVASLSASGYHAVAVTSLGRVFTLGHGIDASFVEEAPVGADATAEGMESDEGDAVMGADADPEAGLVLDGERGAGGGVEEALDEEGEGVDLHVDEDY
jgi:alpha-tubulin suppressor-like RCC1 family protein